MNGLLMLQDSDTGLVEINQLVLRSPDKHGMVFVDLPDDAIILSFDEVAESLLVYYECKKRLVYSIKKRAIKLAITGSLTLEFYKGKDFRFVNTVKSSTGIRWHCFTEA